MPAKDSKGKYRYANLSIEVKRYDKLRRNWEMKIKTDQTFSDWVMTVLEDAVVREVMIKQLFPQMHFVGKKKDGGIIIEDHKELAEITISKKGLLCNVHSGTCEHTLYASMHPLFTDG